MLLVMDQKTTKFLPIASLLCNNAPQSPRKLLTMLRIDCSHSPWSILSVELSQIARLTASLASGYVGKIHAADPRIKHMRETQRCRNPPRPRRFHRNQGRWDRICQDFRVFLIDIAFFYSSSHVIWRNHTSSNMGLDEQKEEREVLDSIFPDEITGRFMLSLSCLLQG